MRKEFEGELVFGDLKAIDFLKRKTSNDQITKKITIDYTSLIRIGVKEEEALNLIQRLIDKKK